MHPLQQRVRRIASLAQRLRWQYALAAIVATLVGAVLLWGVVDYVLHVRDAGVRAIVSLAILLLLVYAVWRWVWPVMQRQPRELVVARQIERHFPELGDRLSSSLAFLVQSETDQTAGSATLRRAVVADTMARAERLDFGDVIDRRPTRRALLTASLLVGLAVMLAVVDPLAAKLVVLRTAWPWTTAAWPRRHELIFDAAPETLAVGSDLELAVIDQAGELPETVMLSYWFDGDRPDQVQTRQMSLLNGKMVHRLDNITRPLKYRAQGGDDTAMPWRELRVLEPPRVTTLTVKVIPPAYTGWPVASTVPDFRALEGSQVELAAQVDQPIRKAQLKLEGDAAIDVPVQVGDDGLTLRLPAAVDKPWILGLVNAYTLELTSRDGLIGNDARYELRVVPDRPPVAAIEKPADNTLVTAQAIVPVRVLVKDDLAIARVELRYLRSDRSDEGEQVIPLYVGPERVAALTSNPLDDGGLLGDSRTFEYAWKLDELTGLAPGVTLTWHIAALDYKPQAGVGAAQRLVIISPTELDDRTAQRQSAILAQLHEVLRQQTGARGQIAALEVQIANVQRLGKQDLDALLGAELNQRQVQRALSSETDGVLVQIAALLADLEINRVDSPDVTRRMQELASEIRLLTKTPLPKIEGELTTAQKLVRDDLDKFGDVPGDGQVKQFDAATRDSTKQALTTAGQSQDEVIAALERLLGDLSQWDNYRRFAREISRLRGDQEELRQQTRELQPRLLSKNVRDLAPAELASLKQLAQRQTDVSRQFDKLLGRMTEARPKLTETQPLVAETIADALDAAKRLGISSQMLDSARGIENNQLGTAGQGQEEATAALNELADILASRKEHELGRRLKQLSAATAELDALAESLKGLKARLKEASQIADPAERKRQLERLTKEERRLAEETQRLARRLERLQAEKAGAHAAQAGERIAQAGEASQQDAVAKALEEAAQAQKHLDDAKQQLKQDIARTQQDLFFEQVAKLEQAIKGLVDRQQTIIDETLRLETLKVNQQGEWTPSQRTSVRSLTEQQRDLVTESSAFLQQLADAPAFSLSLQGAVREMGRAAARLERFQTDAETQGSERIAHARLSQLLTALQPDAPSPPEEPPMPGEEGGQNDQQPAPPGDALTLLAELKLLKLMQAEINRRTTELADPTAGGSKLTPEQAKELDDLAAEQGQLADLVQTIVQKAAQQAAAPPPRVPTNPGEKPSRPQNPLDEELDKALDNELLPGRQ